MIAKYAKSGSAMRATSHGSLVILSPCSANNTTIVNNVVNVTYVEQKTKKKVVVHKVAKTKNEKQSGKVEGAAVHHRQRTCTAAQRQRQPTLVVAGEHAHQW